MIPDWMHEPVAGSTVRPAATVGRTGTRFINKSLRELRGAIRDELQTEHFASRPGYLQSLDPRVKIISLLLFILLSSLTHNIIIMVIMWVVTILLMIASQLPVGRIQIIIWGSMPLITLLVSLPGALNIFIPGTALVMLYDSGQSGMEILGWQLPGEIYFSQQGCLAAFRLAFRTGLSLNAASLLTLTTPANQLFRSLSVLKIPPYFIMIMEMCYRYLAILIYISVEIFEARKVRTIGKLDGKQNRVQYGSSLAALFMRSMSLSEEIFQSMTARGYTGEISIISWPHLQKRDWMFFVLALTALILLYTGGLTFENRAFFL